MKKIRFLIILISIFLPLNVNALIEVDITRGNLNPLPIAVSALYSDQDTNEALKKEIKIDQIGKEISIVIENNLKATGLFNPLEKKAFLQKPDVAHLKPRFEDWSLIKAQALITGKVEYKDDKVRVEFRLWDVLAAREMLAIAFTTVPNNWRRIGHIISDKIYERLTGEKGYFDTRIIYVSEKGPKTKRVKKLAIMDQDGFNTKYLTLGNELVLTPRFNPTNQMVTYLSYFKNLPRVYLLDIETGIQEVVGDFPGMTFAPRFSPDSQSIVMSFSDPKNQANSEIYIMNLNTRTPERITNDPGIDTSPSFSPDGEKIVFNSDRGGSPQLFIMDKDGKNIKRISKGRGVYGNPVWSPRGDQIAFTKLTQGNFHIGIMDINGDNERLIVRDFSLESPAWSPNGRYLIFHRQKRSNLDGTGGETTIHFIDITGYNERIIETPRDGSDPAWSPLL